MGAGAASSARLPRPVSNARPTGSSARTPTSPPSGTRAGCRSSPTETCRRSSACARWRSGRRSGTRSSATAPRSSPTREERRELALVARPRGMEGRGALARDLPCAAEGPRRCETGRGGWDAPAQRAGLGSRTDFLRTPSLSSTATTTCAPARAHALLSAATRKAGRSRWRPCSCAATSPRWRTSPRSPAHGDEGSARRPCRAQPPPRSAYPPAPSTSSPGPT